MKKTYIGDSVYAAWNGAEITLTTENGGAPSNTIVLGPSEFECLLYFVKSMKGKAAKIVYAGDIGWAPGHWPAVLIHEGQEWHRGEEFKNDNGELSYIRYFLTGDSETYVDVVND